MEKFLHIYLLISIIFSTLFVVLGNEKSFPSLNSTDIIEAKKRFMSFDITKLPNPPMPSYTFAIYNRDLFEKSQFKDYDSLLKNKIARSQARADYFASIFGNGNVIGGNGTHESKRDGEGVLQSTSTFYAGGEHVGGFNFGSETTVSYLLLDTGSDLVWWQCAPCLSNGCYIQRNSPIYDSSVSRTYRRINCVAESAKCPTQQAQYKCYQSNTLCRYDYEFADGSRTRGWIAEEEIVFLNDHNRPKILFGCGKDQVSGTKAFTGSYSGIAGLGRRSSTEFRYSLPSQFQSDIMAICLPGIYSAQHGMLAFNTMPFKKETHAELITNTRFSNFYYLNLFTIFVNYNEVQVDPSYWNFNTTDMSGGIMLDTGAAFTYFPRDYYIIFRDAYRREAQNFQMVDVPGHAFDTCYKVDPSQVSGLPHVMLYFGNVGFDNYLYLAQQRQVLVQVGNFYCLAFLPTDSRTAILGAYQLQGVGLTFNTRDNILSFDNNACI